MVPVQNCEDESNETLFSTKHFALYIVMINTTCMMTQFMFKPLQDCDVEDVWLVGEYQSEYKWWTEE